MDVTIFVYRSDAMFDYSALADYLFSEYPNLKKLTDKHGTQGATQAQTLDVVEYLCKTDRETAKGIIRRMLKFGFLRTMGWDPSIIIGVGNFCRSDTLNWGSEHYFRLNN